MSDTRPVAELKYEEARDELVGVVRQLEAGGISLEQSLALWERGEALADRCQQWLDGAKARLDKARAENSSNEAAGDDDSDALGEKHSAS
ncbi:exodeoxyribonuclease VII small subunit [Spelaeicoccus albus]|uniref:Exodeoxyribonuclease 7 small subunit n=1 Tax=Spelaeicoccus albus TaxID=1280376 RepID=A0A7Z0II09_9MICO|nr:exodeoxyribonuclease VII small subunit [Spelaeicoccus albus]NYI68016.1 exodeoxyribonuclease VII small subunit [Spelaeicoccus albus]